MNRRERRAHGVRARVVEWTPTPDTVVSRSFMERAELAAELNNARRARAAIGAWLLHAPQDQVDALVEIQRAFWDNFPNVDPRGDRKTLARQVVNYLEREDRHLEAAS